MIIEWNEKYVLHIYGIQTVISKMVFPKQNDQENLKARKVFELSMFELSRQTCLNLWLGDVYTDSDANTNTNDVAANDTQQTKHDCIRLFGW